MKQELEIRMIRTKKGTECPVLCFVKDYRATFLSFDLRTMISVSGHTAKEIYALNEGETLRIMYTE